MGRINKSESGMSGPVIIGIVTLVAMVIIGVVTLAAMRDWGPFEPKLTPPPAPTPAPAPAPLPSPAPNQPPKIHNLDFVKHKLIGVGDIETVRVIATDLEDEDMAYLWDATRGYILEEGLTTWKMEVDYCAPDSAGPDAISVNVTDVHDNTSTRVKKFWVYDQATVKEAQGYLQQAISQAQINNYQSSVYQLTKLADIVPEFHEVYLLRGQAYTELKYYPQAIDDYRIYIELEPTVADAYLLRAKTNLLWGYRNRALSDIESFYSFAKLTEPWRIEPLQPYKYLLTDSERLKWINDAVSPYALLPNYLQY